MAVVLAALLAGCGSGSGSGSSATGGPGSTPSGASVAASGATSASSAASASLPPGTFRNPVLAADFPDPFVLRDGDTYYAYATTDAAQHLQLARSADLVTWEPLHDPLPKLPAWSSGDTWAPEVAKTSAGYVLYYTARDPDAKRPDGSGSQCVTRATSASPEGPFVDDSQAPLVCQPELGGSIDATYFRDDDGSAWLAWKNDGNCCGLPTRFFIQPLTADGLSLTGKPTDMGVVNDKPWEGAVIEAPTILHHGSEYYLFYSGNNYDSELYAVGYATATRLTGPYRDAPENPILASAWGKPLTSRARGPGHQSIVAAHDGQLWMTFHAFDQDAVGYENFGQRSMWIDRLTFDGSKAVVDGPRDDPQPDP